MTEPREAVQSPADSGRCSKHPTTEDPRPIELNDRLRASLAQHKPTQEVPPSLKRLVDGDPPAEIYDPELGAVSPLEHRRRQLEISLRFAARNLAQANARAHHTIDRGSSLYCGECQAEMESDPLRNAGEHHRSCRTGLVLMLLAELAKLPGTPERAGAHHCRACGLTDGAWVSEEMSAQRADAYGLAPNQRSEMLDVSRWRISTHLCPDVRRIGGAA